VTPPCPAPARPAAPAPLAFPAPLAERAFVAADGRPWRVREHLVRAHDGEVRRRLLVFENRQVLRWLREFPHDWHRRSDAELEALSWTV
jgi:hypothetical protein